MGGAFTALGDGSSGMYWNPAGLADVNNGQVYAESYNLFYKNNTLFLVILMLILLLSLG